MSLQNELIGPHPKTPDEFERWLKSEDIVSKSRGCCRSLTGKIPSTDPQLVEWLAERLIQHHYDENQLERLKKKYQDAGFPEYAEKHRRLPLADRTKKGNAAEVVLIEYIESCRGKALVKAFRLRFNPNVDQSMKGDDCLLVEKIPDTNGDIQIRVYLGETKFRKTPDKDAVLDILDNLRMDKLPLSYSFLIDRLYDHPDTEADAELLDKYLMKEIKAKDNIHYTGLLMSSKKTIDMVRQNLTTDNSKLILVSIGLDSPEVLIEQAYTKAAELMTKPLQL